MRARLLDMGLVSPLRAHSLRLAVAETLGADGEPAALVACAAAPAVTVGRDRGTAAEADPEGGAGHDVPLLRLPGNAPPVAVSEGALLLALLLPQRRAAELALAETGEDRRGWWADLLAPLVADGGAESVAAVDEVAGCVVLAVCLGFAGDELSGSTSPAEVAESWLQALERQAGLELVPSMPMPQELDAVYEWDRRLAAMAGRAATPAATATVP